MNSRIPDSAVYDYGRRTARAQLARLAEVVSSGRLGAIGGSQVPELGRLTAFRVGRAHALAVSSATAGLELTLRALAAGPGTEVIIPALGWVSVGAAVTATGAAVRVAPVTADLSPSWDAIAPLLGPTTAAVIVAHLRGMPAPDIERIASELRGRGVPLIEDCAQAWAVRTGSGGESGSHGTAAVFSVQTHKLIAAGEGGVVLCDDPELMARMRALAGDTRVTTTAPVWRGNARMSEATAAMAIPQLCALDELTGRLRTLQDRVVELLRRVSVAERVLPDVTDRPASNGAHVGVWWPSAQAAQSMWERMYAAGLRGWYPSAGDLHVHDAWPIRAEGSSAEMARYLDVQIPVLEPSDHQAFLATVRQAVGEAGLLANGAGDE